MGNIYDASNEKHQATKQYDKHDLYRVCVCVCVCVCVHMLLSGERVERIYCNILTVWGDSGGV